MWIVAILYVGLVGVTLAATSSKKDGTAALDGLRAWLTKFKHPWNPLRAVGHMLGCSMCLGFWIGFSFLLPMWPMVENQFEGASGWLRLAVHVASGGMVSLASYIADVVLRGIEAVVADKEQANEFVQKQLARVNDKAPAGGEADMAAGGRPVIEGSAGDQEPG